ncbi:leucine-rich repeat, immunoglobulin-like domain and transmembrane domain-containing protein 1a isoform X1 [Stegostoma tigrinum]|uniref:leucine-rich repeat, immunoglobulin-like domain and transmembrane domain-containing protein 1a isoform X1 n=1 Tax=Stegostoma tigrinum TaxID=3053191 RepID=UPI00202AEB46|nr:leucine-rich repeat, immunoglobulin-like domain and transmembrane domain-containing protein 1a isoform X1 [Stegostoma tigrinum]
MSPNIWMLCFLCFGDLSVTFCLCPSQCICTFQSYSGELMTRAVLCNDPEMTLIPNNVPAETVKLVIEKTLIKQISTQAFSSISSLECLRLSSNSISSFDRTSLQGVIGLRELHLDRNALATFPWETLSYLPQLWLLDLHGNVLQSFPSQAATYFRNITYLDLSGNRLTTLSSKVISTWLTPPKVPCASSSTNSSKLIVGLHDNPWECDCRLSELVHLVQTNNSTTALMDPGLMCSWPENLSGSLISSIKLKKCQSPTIQAAESKITTVIGRIVSLYCVATGVPIPEISWSRLDNILLNGTVMQDNSHERLKWSTLHLSTASHQDSGIYLCRANNLVGTSNASISLLVVNSTIALAPIRTTSKRMCLIKMRKLMARYVSALSTTISPRELRRSSHIINGTDYFLTCNHWIKPNEEAPEIVSQSMDPPQVSGLRERRRSVDDSDNITSIPSSTQPEADCLVRTVRVLGGTYHSVSLAWRSLKATNITIFSILYTTFGERKMQRINVGPGKTKITIDGLMPQTKYIVCICLKGLIPKKEQCVIFSTDEVANASGTQKLINLVVITVACVIVVPLTLIVCCGALKRRCRKFLIKPPEDSFQNDSCVTFESLSTGPKPSSTEGEYRTRHDKDESNRLLSPRSSLDSEEATNSEVQQHEYFC